MSFAQVLLAVASVATQDSTASAPLRVRPPVVAIAPILQSLAMHAPLLEAAALQLENVSIHLVPEVWDAQDPGDSLFRAARQALNRDQYARAVELFRQFRERYPRSENVGNSYYWEAFALYRTGSDDALRTARTALTTLADRYPRATTRRDGAVLLQRVQGELARRGDAAAAEAITQEARAAGAATAAREGVRPDQPPQPPEPPKGRGRQRGRSSGCDDDDDIRITALNAVLQMDAERAVPLLKTVLARRDSASTCLRRKAVFLVSQKRSPETSAILLDAVRSDPDQEVREQAVFWLSQVRGEEAVVALDSVLRSSRDPAVQEKAVFALSQHRSERAGAILREFVERRDASAHLREQAIFWLSQHRSAENQAFLKNLYPRLETEELKEKVLFSVSQMRGEDNTRWLLDIALNERESIELRKKALFWAGQSRSASMTDFVALYDRIQNREMKEQLIFVFSQRRQGPALDKLFDIARNETDVELRKKAIFWIGQSRDPRAAQFLQELINQ